MATKAWALLLAAALASGQVLPSLQFLGQGYNLVRGDPHGFQVGEIDPGWQAPILARSSLQHDWVEHLNLCSYSSTTSHVSGGKSAQESLKQEVSAKASVGLPELWSAAFTMSGSVQSMNTSAWKSDTQYFESRARCELFRSMVPPVDFTNLTFTDDFQEAIREIPVDSPGVDAEEWLSAHIIANYGTHMSTAVVTGGLYMHRSWMTSSSYDSLVQTAASGGFTVEAAARSFFGWLANPSGSGGYTWNKEQKEAFQQATQSGGDETFTQGGTFVADDVKAWAAGLSEQYATIGSPSNELVPLSDLLTARHFPGDDAIGRKRQALVSALRGYCARMGAQGCTTRPVDRRASRIDAGESYWSVVWAPGGDRLASCGPDDSFGARVWDAATGNLLQTLQGHTRWVWSVAYRPDGSRFASGSYDGTVWVRDGATGGFLHNLVMGAAVLDVAYSPDGLRLASAGDGPIQVLDTFTGVLLLTFPNSSGARGLAYSPDGTRLATSGDLARIRIWDAATGSLLMGLASASTNASCVAYSPDGQRLASGHHDDSAVRVWDAVTGVLLQTVQGHTRPVFSVAYSPDGAYLASGSIDNSIRIWDVANGTLLHTLQVRTADLATPLAEEVVV